MQTSSTDTAQPDRSLKAVVDTITDSWVYRAFKIIALASSIILLFLPGITRAVRIGAGILAAIVAVTYIYQLIQGPVRQLSTRFAHSIMARKYGYEYKKQVIKGTLNRDDGSMSLAREVHVKATAVQGNIRHYLHSMDENPASPFGLQEVEALYPRSVQITAQRVDEHSRPNRMLIQVNFRPALGPGDSAGYRILEAFPAGSFATSLEAIDEGRFPYEYQSWHINKPTRHLKLQVSIPLALDPTEYDYDVWYAGFSYQRHRAQFETLAESFTSRVEMTDRGYHQVLALDVRYPVLGLVYVLKWRYKKRRSAKLETPTGTPTSVL